MWMIHSKISLIRIQIPNAFQHLLYCLRYNEYEWSLSFWQHCLQSCTSYVTQVFDMIVSAKLVTIHTWHSQYYELLITFQSDKINHISKAGFGLFLIRFCFSVTMAFIKPYFTFDNFNVFRISSFVIKNMKT